ncbi:uncharacterized protein LOC122542067 isoform X2 [Chiloscyllium plagiosum]|uniref:uncharacterized protein LOC122542067 isoform X2 n=1 Tax=Chiloscyllium plagiosum TaxID=36176 RepID=UPI001CB86CF9|nr:uncharacterized protein LOC122542067 isoform X2 [Chiloscyllium plagiosum]
MECPLCGNSFSEAVIQHHAWNCDGSRFEEGLLTQHGAASVASENYQLATCTSYFHQHLDGVGSVVYSNITAVPHCSTEYFQKTTAVKTQECPLCGQSFPTNEIIEHAAFCNGPGFSRVLEQEIPNYSKAPEREGASDTMELFWSYVNGKEHAVPRAAVGAEEAKRVLSSKEVEEDSVLDLEKVLQYLKKMEDAISQDPEFKQFWSQKPLLFLRNGLKYLFWRLLFLGSPKWVAGDRYCVLLLLFWRVD